LSNRVDELRRARTGKNAARPVFSCLGDMLAHYGRAASGRDAILAPEREPATFGTLLACARDAVRALRRAGIGRNDRVAAILPDGPEAATAIVSVASGAICAPLNSSFTADELRRYFVELKVSALLTRSDIGAAGIAAAGALGLPVFHLSAPGPVAGLFSITAPSTRRIGDLTGDDFASGADDAFILLTSGTTSRPKTIPLTHAAVCRSAHNVGAAIALKPSDRLLSVLPLFHGHGLISGVIGSLAAGSSVVVTSGFNATAFFGWLREFRPTWYTAVPAIHRAVLAAAEQDPRSASQSPLRLIRSASSTLPAKLLGGLEGAFGVPVIDTFGMTEAATQIAANPLKRRKLGSVGRSAGAEITILGADGHTLAAGERGEIALRGPTISRGYDNDPAATRQAFRDGWFRTGDLGYLDEDGYLFIVGRIKEVINRGGQKIAPGEVEEALLSHPDIVDAVAFAIPHARLGADVAAAVVPRLGATVSAPKLRDFVRKRLAAFKVPGLIRVVTEIPKGAGGKIKRAELATALALTQPIAPMQSRGKVAAPRSELQREIAKIWIDLLDVEEIGAEQDIFALGVDSITVTQLISRLRERFTVDFSFKDIFDAPTIAKLAARIQGARKTSDSASSSLRVTGKNGVRSAKNGSLPVTVVQERMLRIEREVPGLPQFNLPFAYRFKGPLNVAALRRSVIEVVRRHDSLRTRFAWRNDEPAAFVAPPAKIKISFVVEDLAAGAPAGDSRTKILLRRKAALAAERESLKPFDMSRAPLVRARLLRFGAEDHVLLLVVHDIVIDGWSMGVFMEDVARFYAAFAAGSRVRLPEPALRFSDFVRWQRQWCAGEAAERQFAYWHKRLHKASALFADRSDDGGNELGERITRERLRIPNNVLAQLADLGHSRGATLFVTLLAGFKALLLLRSGRNDICVATAMANRAQLGTENVIGPFATTAIIRTRVDGDLTFHETLDRVREGVLQAYANQELPFDILADRLADEYGADPESLIQVYFVLQIAFRRRPKLPGLTVRPFSYREGQSVMPIDRTRLTMTLNETPAGIIGSCSHKSGPSEQLWVDDYKDILAAMAANPRKRLGSFADRLNRQPAPRSKQ
jgi:acyl-CoA synthetase (AMP-forming)/AMP-acid ligase II/acyl carrier protein/NRPS condensation-like uncharacterized protein